MPHTYRRDAATFPSTGRSPWEPQSLTLSKYYMLCLVSLTTLSTLLGQTDVLDARETDNAQQRPLGPTAAKPASLTVDAMVEDYLLVANKIESSSSGGSNSNEIEKKSNWCGSASSVEVQRRFEYHFKLAGVKVVMWHYRSLVADGTPALDAGLYLSVGLCMYVCFYVLTRYPGARKVYLSRTST